MLNHKGSALLADVAEIPNGKTCYERTSDGNIRVCPFWAERSNAQPHARGFCALIGAGDGDAPSLFWLHDQIKQCGIHE